MRQSTGVELLGANDPRGTSIGVIHVAATDDRKNILAAILTQEKLGRRQIVVELPGQNKAFQRPADFDDLKNMRRKLQAQLIFIVPQGVAVGEYAKQRRFPIYPTLDAYSNALMADPQTAAPDKK